MVSVASRRRSCRAQRWARPGTTARSAALIDIGAADAGGVARADIAALKADTTRWKLYGKVAAILGTPVYVGVLALAIEAAKQWLGL